MTYRTALALIFLYVCTPALAGTPPLGTVNIPALVEKVDKGVVNIRALQLVRQSTGIAPPGFEEWYQLYGIPTERIAKQPSLGSGFVINSDGVILTNHHVIRNAAEIEVFFNDAAKSKIRAKIVGSDPKTDLAVLRVKPGPYLAPLELGNSDSLKVGETVVAIGNPFGLSHTVTAGIISAKNRVIGQGAYDNFLQTDASINFGNSGGPLFNAEGEVIGINTAISAQGQGLGFAIPVNQAKRLLPDLLQFGRVRRGWMGAWLVTTPYGLGVNDVVVNSPAHKAGIRAGDFIVGVEDDEVEELEAAERVLGSKKPGEEVQVQIRRETKLLRRMQKLRLKLIEEPQGANLPKGTI